MAAFKQKTEHMLTQLGGRIITQILFMGGVTFLAFDTLKTLFTKKTQWNLVVQQIYFVGVKSLSLTNLIAIFTGMVLALQFIVGLKRFGLELYVGQIIGMAICRELGPVLTSLMVAARVGSGIAAELGSMTVTEQVLALEAMGADPVSKLVVPRVLVVTLMTPILTIMADVVGIFGGMIITIFETGVGPKFYIDQIIRTVEVDDFLSGISKTLFFGFLIGVLSCYHGLKATRGTQGVGNATTASVVASSVAVFVADYFLTKMFLIF
ncbi:ABC transporter permease [bacterium]|nr:ABC transporter permease [bacterium]